MKKDKYQCEVVDIITPNKIILNGLWFGTQVAKFGFIYVHGLASSVFSKIDLLTSLAGKNFSVLAINTRGHDKVTRVLKLDKRTNKGYRSLRAGGAHEVFTECKDDLAGAVEFMLARKIRNIYLIGHSTGCQKSVYYLAVGKHREKVKGAILLCPMSDYAAAVKFFGQEKLKKIASLAKQMVHRGQKHHLIPFDLWPSYDDAQRFLSLYTAHSQEEIFSYVTAHKNPKFLIGVKKPLLVVLASEDEYQDRPTEQIADWFKKYLSSPSSRVVILTNAKHSLSGYEGTIVKLIRSWLNNFKNKKY